MLTPRQVTIMYMLASGWSHKRIAKKMGITQATVRSMLYGESYGILERLDAHNVAEAMAKWMKDEIGI